MDPTMTSAPAEAQPEREAQPDKQSQPAIRAALFDMDRTLVRKNTPQLYTRYQRDIGEVGWAQSLRVTWWIVKYTLGLADTLTIARTAAQHGATVTSAAEWSAACAFELQLPPSTAFKLDFGD